RELRKARRLTDTMESELGGVWRVLKAGVESLGIAIGVIDEEMEEFGKRITEVVSTFTDWIKTHKKLVLLIAQSVGWFVAAGAAILSMGAAIWTVGVGVGVFISILHGLQAAMLFLVTPTPMAFAFWITVGLIALTGAADGAIQSMQELFVSIRQTLAVGDKQRARDKEKIQRLEELSKKQKLSNDEQKEARRLIQNLYPIYGDLGITFDKVTGSIQGMTDALKEFHEILDRNTALAIRGQMAKLDARMEEVRNRERTLLEIVSGSVQENPSLWQMLSTDTAPGSAATEWAERKFNELRAIQRERNELQQRLNDLRTGKPRVVTDTKSPTVTGVPGFLDEEAEAELAKWNRRLHELFIAGIEDERERAMVAINARYQYELDKAKENAELITAITFARDAEIANTRVEFARQAEEEEKRNAEELADEKLSLQDRIVRAQINATLKGKEKEAALLAQRRKEALRDSSFPELTAKLFDLKAKGLAPQLARAARSIGTFSSEQAKLFGGSSVQERALGTLKMLAQIDKDQLRELKRITFEATA
ncbi:hypothetical protein LCGC14_2302400, partial [marine sediment metagenome]